MKIVEAQKRMLEDELIRNEEKLKKCRESKKHDETPFGASNELGREINMLDKEIKRIKGLLNTADIIKNPSTDRIMLGSEATLLMNFGEEETEQLHVALIEDFVSREAQSGCFTSIGSDLGKAIYGKKEGENFAYKIASSGISVTGEVLTIEKAKESNQVVLKKEIRK